MESPRPASKLRVRSSSFFDLLKHSALGTLPRSCVVFIDSQLVISRLVYSLCEPQDPGLRARSPEQYQTTLWWRRLIYASQSDLNIWLQRDEWWKENVRWLENHVSKWLNPIWRWRTGPSCRSLSFHINSRASLSSFSSSGFLVDQKHQEKKRLRRKRGFSW